MDENEKRIRSRLKNDLIHYATKCLKIRTKSGSIEPFVFNKAQQFIHEQLEKQLRETGKVRALILKARQQGACFVPSMKVLTAEYRWTPIDNVKVGDKLVACDENYPGVNANGRSLTRRFRMAIVEAKREFHKETFEVLFDNGARLEVTGDHRMLCKRRGGDDQLWRHVVDFKVGDHVRAVARPPSYESSYEDGWMGDIPPWVKITSIKPNGSKRVVDIQTSTKTFICEGLVSHNSTYISARFYHKTTHSAGIQAFILTHSLEATNNLFKMAKRYYENTPAIVRPEVSTSNAKELVFGSLDSGYKLGTAENKNVGRSSTIQLAHLSECAFWSNAPDHATGIMQAIPNAYNTEVIMESTANGVGNYFHQQWQAAEAGLSDFIAIFIPWYWQDEYTRQVDNDFKMTAKEEELKEAYALTDEQLSWRRAKIVELSVSGMNGESAFKQEYPANAVESFRMTGEDSFISSDIVMKARTHTAEKYGPLLLGVDPARFGDDRTSIIRRQGRVAFGLESYSKKDTMEVAGIVKTIIDNERPHKVFIDVGGLGAGVVDRLRELVGRDIVVAVNAGSSPFDGRKYSNKRAEMWALCKQWLEDDMGAQIPNSDSLHADLCGIRYKVDSNSRLVMEQKAEMKKRGLRSSDEADALCLSFSLPDSSFDNKRNSVLDKLADSFNQRLAAKDYLR